ncbi:uncharacterized protein Bfra_006702 [Botrytis fragariae]|uniref:Uncharacterized protein n=1 Tax=Botrytis fragariae TaxID=1964551 RepID=A0A8H6EPB6_9HELO|nr:uncharacterized protein Bfra_006702 [Botrytis fragariae]KAF5879494.1 hypothetical protein Bfra_006702 [Botrytis fragariae]
MKTFWQKSHQLRIIKLFGPIIRVLDSNCVPRVHNLKTLSATYNNVDDDDLEAALAMTIAYAEENFVEDCDHSFLHDLVDEIGEAKECKNDYEFGTAHRQCCAEETLGAELRAKFGYVASVIYFKGFFLAYHLGNDGKLFSGVDSKTGMTPVREFSKLVSIAS